ncbi:MAG: FmdB family zinc ribbon protein [Fimbriiglobus sp.]
MPTYDFVCDGCGHAFEEWQSFKDEPLTKCPSCKKKKLRRLFGSGAAVIFKGSGFYETDYRKDSYKDAAKKDADAAKPAEPKADAAAAAKPEATSPPPPPPAAEPAKPAGKAKKGK